MMYIINSILLAYLTTSLSILGIIYLFGLNKDYSLISSDEIDSLQLISNIGDSYDDYSYSQYDSEAIEMINL